MLDTKSADWNILYLRNMSYGQLLLIIVSFLLCGSCSSSSPHANSPKCEQLLFQVSLDNNAKIALINERNDTIYVIERVGTTWDMDDIIISPAGFHFDGIVKVNQGNMIAILRSSDSKGD